MTRSTLHAAMLLASIVLAPRQPWAHPALAVPEVTEQRLTLSQAMTAAMKNPRLALARLDIQAAGTRVDEADAARMPRLSATAFLAPSPKAICANTDCTVTTPQNQSLAFSGAFGGVSLTVTQPLYTFGKIAAARQAARAGHLASVALADELAGDTAVEVARAYWGVKLARTLGWMLDDGLDDITAALKSDDSKSMSVQDRQRITVLIAEAKAQRADATLGEAQALAGLRALTQMPNADVDEAELAPIANDSNNVSGHTNGDRPMVRAAQAGIAASAALATMEARQALPDLALVGQVGLSRAQGVDDPPSVFANDPYNSTSGGVALVLRWSVEPWTVTAKTARAHVQSQRAQWQAAGAATVADLERSNARAVLNAAKTKVAATAEGEVAARAWVASIVQAQAIGTAEPREMVDAYLAWFQMRARWAAAASDLNVALVQLARAHGEFHADGSVQSAEQR
jgi:outer membrane protein, multidrug efflux system